MSNNIVNIEEETTVDISKLKGKKIFTFRFINFNNDHFITEKFVNVLLETLNRYIDPVSINIIFVKE